MGALRTRWRNVAESFWFFPGLTAAALALLALAAIALDRRVDDDDLLLPAFGGDASAARDVLAAIAGSLVTVAGVTLSLTIVTLQLVAGQYTPRAVRGFLSDRVNQVTAGGFIGIVAYCLLVLRVIRGEDGDGPFVPRLAVTGAIVLALLALALLVVFVHHLAASVRVSHIAADIARETLSALDSPYPRDGERAGGEPLEPTGEALVVQPTRPGFVQSIALDALAGAAEPGGAVDVHVAPGDFVTEQTPVASIRPTPRDAAAAVRRVRAAVFVTSERTLGQDASFGLRQLTDIALRALSPGVNDPTTAVLCIGYLRACLERRAAAPSYPVERLAAARGVELRVRTRTLAEDVDDSLVELGRFASANARVVVALLDAVRGALAVAPPSSADVLRSAAAGIVAAALADATTDRDRAVVRAAATGLTAIT